MENKKEVVIIGHKNPDTDSICSAIAYAYLKNQLNTNYIFTPKRCGDISKETAYVLDKFNVDHPKLQKDVRTQVSDIEIRVVESVEKNLSIKNAYSIMRDKDVFTLVVAKKDNKIDGIISLGDIAASDMDVYDNKILSKAKTPYKNIIETLDGRVICGDIDGCFNEGSVKIAANTPELMEEFIHPGDLVIMGNRIESQFFAIELGVSCIVLCTNNDVNEHILKRAKEKGCIIISSPHDTYTVTRLINRSMPIEYFMTTKDIMSFRIDDFTNDVKEIMAKTRLRYFPVLDEKGKYIGQISKRSFLAMDKKRVILVDHNEKNQAVSGIEYSDILEIIDHHKLGSLETVNPVLFRNQPVGCTATIIYQMYVENNVEVPKDMAGILVSAILSDTLLFRSPTCTPIDKMAAEMLSKICEVDINTLGEDMFSAGSDFKSRTEEELFYQDFKPFNAGDLVFGVGQIMGMNANDINDLKHRMNPYMDELIKSSKFDVLIFVLTNILEESSTLIIKGKKAKEIIEIAYGNDFDNDSIYVAGLVSRKKQLVPALMNALQQ